MKRGNGGLLCEPRGSDPARHRRSDRAEIGGRRFSDACRAVFEPADFLVEFAIYVFAALLYIVALKRIPVSLAFPSVSASYAVVAVLAHILWGEPFGWPQIAGIALIGGGVILIHQH